MGFVAVVFIPTFFVFDKIIGVFAMELRILEVYLNVAEFGDGIYGVKSAAKRFFRKPPSTLTNKEAALLAAILPNPITFKAAAPSDYVKQRTRIIEKQTRNLGDSYLKGIWSKSRKEVKRE
jgi:membrane carboxypeptidase/penicillin-binding protein